MASLTMLIIGKEPTKGHAGCNLIGSLPVVKVPSIVL
jgi:hypothetical protein